MEGELAYLSGSRGGGRRTERMCSREERKRRKKVAEEGLQRHLENSSSVSSGSHDGRSSAASNLDVADRLTYLEQRMQMQEDEIQLLKMTLADVLKRLNISEEHQAATAGGRRVPGTKGRPVSMALPPRPHMVTSTAASLRKSSTLPSSATGRNYSPTPPRSGVRSPAGSVKDSPCKTPKTRPSSSASTCKTANEGSSRSREGSVTLGTRRVTHCKVTMQIYLSPLARKTGSSESATSAPTVPAGGGGPGHLQARGGAKTVARRNSPSFTLNLQKTTTNVSNNKNTQQDAPNFTSPLKSPSQYFQICY
ncbi:echinoderm microtubule-associated protein-like 1 isoform X2 [Dunckerocampus dactyliophorus]|uniref:echinoderm microtubule-associated protein-like 1 isoform X2 n=1 Tax=Dunckerocampus dactyliophorus TaxID=161453 RepID=UPI0024061081|nr:echinoderm microtubule-associated protein-like 1 isoform X2 [Dunckerocampus dactyliophorus]